MGIQTRPEGVIEIATGMTAEWLLEGRAVAFVMSSTEDAAVEKFYQYILKIMDEWPEDYPYLAIYQMANSQVMMTSHIRERLAEIVEYRPSLHGRSAAVLPGGAASHAIRLFLMARAKKGARAKKYFTSRAEALNWLKEALPK